MENTQNFANIALTDALSIAAKKKLAKPAVKKALAVKDVKAHTTLAPKAKSKKVAVKDVAKAETKKAPKAVKVTTRPSMKSINAALEAAGSKLHVKGANAKIVLVNAHGAEKPMEEKRWNDHTITEWVEIITK